MLRQHVPQALASEKGFRWRGGDVSRLEGLTDAVFALSLTLLIVSLEVPTSFGDLQAAFLDLPAFGLCFTILIMFWWYHFQYHRRYGFEDLPAMVLNSILLFLIMFYVYPLKFLFGLLVAMFRGDPIPNTVTGDGTLQPIITLDQIPRLMLFYSAGFTGIFLVFVVMYVRAYRLREVLELNPTEVSITKTYIRVHSISAGIGATSMALVMISPSLSALAGWIYAAMGPIHGLHGYFSGRALERQVKPSGSEP